MTRSIVAFGAVTFLVLIGAFFAFEEPGFAMILALLAGLAAGVVAYFFFPDKSVSYETEASQLVRDVEQDAKKIRSYGSSFSEKSDMRNRLDQSCQAVFDLIDLVKQKDASNILTVTTRIKVHVEAVCMAMEQYGKITKNPGYYRQPDEAKHQIEEGVRNFDDFIHGLVQNYNQGDLDRVKIELKAVSPMKIPTPREGL